MNKFKIYVLFPFLALLFVSCSSREIKDLQQSVSTLEGRVVNYQQQTSQESAETVTKVSEVNQSINKAFRDIRYAQSNLETLTEQLSNRLAKVERDVTALQQNTNQLNSFSNDSYANLTDKYTALENNYNAQRKQDLESIQNNLNALTADINNLKSSQGSASQSIRNIERQIASMSEENRKIYRQILTELGAKVPDEIQAPAESGDIHTVQSGETLSAIASKYGVNVQALQQLNNIEDASRIRVGQKIKIPK